MRHGSTLWNSERRFQGHADVPLDAQGRAQAQALAALFRHERFDHAVSSDLARAYETARAIRAGAPVERDDRWREFAFGEWEGLTWKQIVERWPHLTEQGSTAAKLYAPPGGETFDAVCARVRAALSDLEKSGHANVLVVTHAGALHAVLHTFFGDGETQMQEVLAVRFLPASVTRIRLDDGAATVEALSDVAHLATS